MTFLSFIKSFRGSEGVGIKKSNLLTITTGTLPLNKYYGELNVIMKREELLGQDKQRSCNIITTNHF